LQKSLIIIKVRKHRVRGCHVLNLYTPAYNRTPRDRNLFHCRQLLFTQRLVSNMSRFRLRQVSLC